MNPREPEHAFQYPPIWRLQPAILLQRDQYWRFDFHASLMDEAAEQKGPSMRQNQLLKSRTKELPARTMSMHHVCLVVSDIADTRDFYVNVLGFEEIHRPTDFVFHGAYFHNGDVEVHVVQESEPGRLSRHAPEWGGEELRTGLCHHFAVMVDSFEPFLAAMRERGLERVGGPRVRDDYVEQIYIADPDGHVIELLVPAHSGVRATRGALKFSIWGSRSLSLPDTTSLIRGSSMDCPVRNKLRAMGPWPGCW